MQTVGPAKRLSKLSVAAVAGTSLSRCFFLLHHVAAPFNIIFTFTIFLLTAPPVTPRLRQLPLASLLFMLCCSLSAQPAVAEPLAAKTSLSVTAAEQAWLEEHQPIRVAFDGYFPPYSVLNEDGEFEGLAVDVMRILAERAGFRIELSTHAVWKDLYAAAQRREVDLVATMGDRPERTEWFVFTRPYIFKSLVIMTRENAPVIESPADLAGRRVALVKSYQYVQELLEKHPSIQPYFVDTMLDGMNAVAVGKVDAVITFNGAGHYLKAKYQLNNLQFAAVFERDRFSESIGIRNDWPELASILDKALDSISEDEILALSHRWVGPELLPGIAPRLFVSSLTVTLGGIVILVTLFIIWNRILKKQVRRRTEELHQEFAERKKAVEAQATSELRFRDVLENLQLIAVLLDTNGRVTFCNDFLLRLTNLTQEQVLGSDWFDLMIPDAHPEVKQLFLNSLKSGKVVPHFENPIILPDRTIRHIFWNNTVLRDSSGLVVGTASIGEDITSRKQAVEKLAEQAFFNQQIINSTDDHIAVVDKNGIILSVNDAWRNFALANLGGDESAWGVGVSYFVDCDKKWGDVNSAEKAYEGIKNVMKGTMTNFQLEYPCHNPGVENRWFLMNTLPMKEGGGSVLISHTNITERKLTEIELKKHREHLETLVKERTVNLEEKTRELQKSQTAMQYLLEDINEANAKLKEVDQLKSMFIASMSHELRTPLNSVIGYSSILLNEWTGPLNDEQKQNISAVLRSGKHLLSLINDVIDLSKVEAGMLEVSSDEFDLAELMTELEQNFSKQVLDKQLSLSVQRLSLPMQTDRRRLLQSLLNLVSNAIKFTEQGEVKVTIQTEAAGLVTITVSDTGIGIATEDQTSLFKPFSRISSPLSTSVLGTGLGLYLTKKIVTEVLHGTISVKSEAGHGSSFSIRVPNRLQDDPMRAILEPAVQHPIA